MKSSIKNNAKFKKLGAKHLTLGLESGKAELFQEAVWDLVEANGGIEIMAKKTKIPVRQLKRALGDQEIFQWWVNVAMIVKAFGNGRLGFVPKEQLSEKS